jgi:hypothetical protein
MHTPTPWEAEDAVIFCPGKRLTIAVMYGNELLKSLNWKEQKANAAHIVKCVNLHDELVGALKMARAECEHFYSNGTRYLAICTAIAKAEAHNEN